MPKSIGGLFGFVMVAVITVAVGFFVLTRIPGIWAWLQPKSEG